MRHRALASGDERVLVAVLDKGDEAGAELRALAAEAGITGASLAAVGAFESCTLGYFDRHSKDYVEIPVGEQVEVLSFLGDIGVTNGEVVVHVHVVLGRRDGSTVGGHLLRGVVWPTLEVVMRETPSTLRRRLDPGTGLALIDLPDG